MWANRRTLSDEISSAPALYVTLLAAGMEVQLLRLRYIPWYEF